MTSIHFSPDVDTTQQQQQQQQQQQEQQQQQLPYHLPGGPGRVRLQKWMICDPHKSSKCG